MSSRIQQAHSYLVKSATFDYSPAAVRLGRAYEFEEIGLPYNPLLSVQYYTLASALDNPEGDMGLSRWFTNGLEHHFERDAYMVYAFAVRAACAGLSSAVELVKLSQGLGLSSRDDLYLGKPWHGPVSMAYAFRITCSSDLFP